MQQGSPSVEWQCCGDATRQYAIDQRATVEALKRVSCVFVAINRDDQPDRHTDRSQDLHDALIRSLSCLLLVAAAPKTGTLHTIMAQYWQASQTLSIHGNSGRKKEDKQPDYTPIWGIPLYKYTRAHDTFCGIQIMLCSGNCPRTREHYAKEPPTLNQVE